MTLRTEDFDYVRTLVRQSSAIVLEDSKAYLVDSRLQPLARQEGIASVADLVAQLRTGRSRALQQKVVEAMTTNETYFFRDIQPFEALRKLVLPQLIKSREAERRLAIWCGASSTGQEPYSLSILLREHFPALNNWSLTFLATDLSTEVLDKAREARYSQIEINRGMPAPLLVKYFRREGMVWVLKDDVRRMVEFRPLNLIEPWPGMPRADLVMLRNVLIYFDVATKKGILAKVRQVLRPDGYLFLGGAESTFGVDDAFERVEVERTSCYRLRR
jgi:chemotaxis protein methyltransferase CheR